MNDTFVCAHCRNTFPTTEQIIVSDNLYCTDCADDLTTACSHCGRQITNDENEGSVDDPLCRACYDHYYVTCHQCDRIILADDANGDIDDYYYCAQCASTYDHSEIIHEHYYKPTPILYGKGNRRFGIELEIDNGGKSPDYAKQLLELANARGEYLYVKLDGSLTDGLELVSHPMTLDFHLKRMPWAQIMHKALTLGYYSHQTDTCGLHIHISRSALGDTPEEQDNAIGRILFFVESHWKELLRFSRRTNAQLNRWAARYGYKDHPREVLDAAKQSYSGRYTCVNILNHDTVEIRIFRGTLRYTTLAATLQLVNEICNVAVTFSDETLQQQSWSEFVARLNEAKVPELIAYLKERRLYVNEPIAAGEEQ